MAAPSLFFITTIIIIIMAALFLSPSEAKFYGAGYSLNPVHPGYALNPGYAPQGKATGRHKNHCAYVTEKLVSFSVPDGAAPYVKAQYHKCPWGQKCPALTYRVMYKPLFKVAQKTVTELEWRCCPGFSGYGCMDGPPLYQHPLPPFKGPPMKGPMFKGPPPPPYKGPMFKGPTPPLFKGPPYKGPQFKGPPPPYKGPMFKGPMLFKGPPVSAPVKSGPWGHHEAPPTGNFHTYPMRHFGPPGSSSSYPDPSFEPEPMLEPDHHPDQEPDHHPDQEPDHHPDQEPDHHPDQEPDHHQEPDHGAPGEHHLEELPPSSGAEQQLRGDGGDGGDGSGPALDRVTEERMFRMEEEVQRLTRGLDSLRVTVDGLEESLRASLRADANRMLSALLSAGAAPPGAAPPAASALSGRPGAAPPAVGFGEIPGGGEEAAGALDGKQVFITGVAELNGRVEELRAELEAKASELQRLKATVNGHDGQLKRISGSGDSRVNVTELMESTLTTARAEILDGLERRVETAEGRCEEKAGDVGRQCQREQEQRQERAEDALHQSTQDLRAELRELQLQVMELKVEEGGCCSSGSAGGLLDRVQLLEAAVSGLNRSQGHLRVELGAHKDHIEGILEGRLGYVESRLNLSTVDPGRRSGGGAGGAIEARMEGKLRALECRLMTAVEELGNTTAPALLEGHVVPALETELESIRERLDVDMDRVQKQLSGLETLCSSSCSSALQGDSPEPGALLASDALGERIDALNTTVRTLQRRLNLKEQLERAEREPPFQGELTLLRFNVRSVNRTLRGLQGSLGSVVQQVERTNSTWHEREARLAQQVKGVVQLVGHQAAMLGAGERRLSRVKGELQEMKRRLQEEVRGCRSTAMGVQKEVSQVNGRVANVEHRCRGLDLLTDDLERVREELERQSSGLLLQVNGTLSSHALQLSQIRAELRNCTDGADAQTLPQGAELQTLPQGAELQTLPQGAELGRGDVFTLH